MPINGVNPVALIDELKAVDFANLQSAVNSDLSDMQVTIDNIDIAQAVADIPAGAVGSYVIARVDASSNGVGTLLGGEFVSGNDLNETSLTYDIGSGMLYRDGLVLSGTYEAQKSYVRDDIAFSLFKRVL